VLCPFCEELLCWTVCFCCSVHSPHTVKTSYLARWYEKHISSSSHPSRYDDLRRRHPLGINLSLLSVPTARLAHHDSLISPDVNMAADDVSAGDPDTPPSILVHLLPANFEKASFLTPSMIKYHQNEYDRPGYGLAYIVSNAFEITKDVSELSSEKIRFHLDLCHLCVALTQENKKSLGLIIKEVIYYFTDVAPHDLSNPSIQDNFSNEVQLSLQTKLPQLSSSHFTVIGSVLKASLTNIEATACHCNNASRRGIFSASRPPAKEKDLNTLYFEGSIRPCTPTYLVPGHTWHQTVLMPSSRYVKLFHRSLP
jgi:hypothetical protein